MKLTTIEYHVTKDKCGAADKNQNANFEMGFIINTDSLRKYDIIAGTKQQIETKRIELKKKNQSL